MAVRADDVDLGRDRSLVEQFQAGDTTAFDDLYQRYFQRLFRFCLKRVGDPHDAEELAQEAFTRAFLHLETFDGERRFYPWVTVIASRLCVDTHRRRSRSQPSDEIDLGTEDGGQDDIVNSVDLTLLDQAMGNLAPRHREVLDLRERHELSYQSIADHYGVSLGTVEALLWRARKALRREFLAITDGDVPSIIVGGPAIAWRSRIWRTVRARFVGRAARTTPFLAGAAGVAVVGFGAFVFGGSSAPSAGALSTARPAAASTANAAPASAAAAALPTTAVGSTHVASHASAVPGSPQLLQNHVADGATSAARVNNEPTHVWVAGVGVGVDPTELAQQGQSFAQFVVSQSAGRTMP